jgi:hypothetical protein
MHDSAAKPGGADLAAFRERVEFMARDCPSAGIRIVGLLRPRLRKTLGAQTNDRLAEPAT